MPSRVVTRGQPVEIETASISGVIKGRVLQTTSSANIQKNTLEVKVELIDPPPNVSPEMLVTATFFARVVEQSDRETTDSERMFVPSQLVVSGDSGAFVWVVDADELAQQRSVEVGSPNTGGLVEIKAGLNVTDKLIAGGSEGLKQGSPVKVTGDDETIGMD